jgi:hypothetical protein
MALDFVEKFWIDAAINALYSHGLVACRHITLHVEEAHQIINKVAKTKLNFTAVSNIPAIIVTHT